MYFWSIKEKSKENFFDILKILFDLWGNFWCTILTFLSKIYKFGKILRTSPTLILMWNKSVYDKFIHFMWQSVLKGNNEKRLGWKRAGMMMRVRRIAHVSQSNSLPLIHIHIHILILILTKSNRDLSTTTTTSWCHQTRRAMKI